MDVHFSFIVGNQCLFRSVEDQSFALCTFAQLGDVVQTQHHILCRHRNRRAIGRVQNVVRLKHQHLCFQDCFVAQGQMHSHLVAIEVGVECCTCQRVELNGFSFNHLRLEGLDTQTVKCRSTVEQHGVSLHHIFQDVPNHRFLAVDDFLGRFHRLHNAAFYQLTDDKRFVKLGSHQFRNTAFTHLQLRTYDDNRTCRIVNTFTQQVLTETSLLAFQAIRERLQRTVGISLDSTRLA